jgi:FkbM family methyltransferase
MKPDRLKDIIRWHVQKPVLHAMLRSDAHAESAVFADAIVPTAVIDRDAICYCGGVGEDIRFEELLIERMGALVWAFDPTPRSVRFIEQRGPLPEQFHFVPQGLWSEDATLRFYAPSNPSYVSHTVEGPQGGATHFDAPCRSVPSLMRELGHERIDLLKLNIEGAEDRVLSGALDAGVRPRVITLTYEGRRAFRKALNWTRRLRYEGYQVLGVRGWFVTYVHEPISPGGPARTPPLPPG